MRFFGQKLRILSNYLSGVSHHQTGLADIGQVKLKPAGHMCGNTPENTKPHQRRLMGFCVYDWHTRFSGLGHLRAGSLADEGRDQT